MWTRHEFDYFFLILSVEMRIPAVHQVEFVCPSNLESN
jgi:hypothetical protein